MNIIFSKITLENLEDYCNKYLLNKTWKYYLESVLILVFYIAWFALFGFLLKYFLPIMWEKAIGEPYLSANLISSKELRRWLILFNLTIIYILAVLLKFISYIKEQLLPLHKKYNNEMEILNKLAEYGTLLYLEESLKSFPIVDIIKDPEINLIKITLKEENEAKFSVEIYLESHFNETVKGNIVDFSWIDTEICGIFKENKLPQMAI